MNDLPLFSVCRKSYDTPTDGEKLVINMSQCMRFPTMWHFDMFRLGRASAASF